MMAEEIPIIMLPPLDPRVDADGNAVIDADRDAGTTRGSRVRPRGRPFAKGNPGPRGLKRPTAAEEMNLAEQGIGGHSTPEAMVVEGEVVSSASTSGLPAQPPAHHPAPAHPPATIQAAPIDPTARAREALVRESRALYRRSCALLEEAEGLVREARHYDGTMERSDWIKARASALQASSSVAKQVQGFAELLAKLEGLLRTGTQVNVAVAYVQSPEWRRLKRALLSALEPHPEALEAVARALEGLE